MLYNIYILNYIIGGFLCTEDLTKIDELSKYYNYFVKQNLIIEKEIEYHPNLFIKNIKAKYLSVEWNYTNSFYEYFKKFKEIIIHSKVFILDSKEEFEFENNKNIEIIVKIPKTLFEKITRYYLNYYDDINELAIFAMDKGDLDSIKLLYKNGYNLNQNVSLIKNSCELMSCYGHLECLKFLHQNGYYLKNSIKYATDNDCKRYIIENSIPKILENKYLKMFKILYIEYQMFIN